MIAHLPRTLVDRMDRCLTIRRAMMLVRDLGNVQGDMQDLSYDESLAWLVYAEQVNNGECPTMLHKRIRSRVDPFTLQYVATGRAG